MMSNLSETLKECGPVNTVVKKTLREVAEDDLLLEIGRKAIEETLIEFRDSRIGLLNRGNGLVCRESDGRDSSIIRLGPETALRIGLKAIADSIANPKGVDE